MNSKINNPNESVLDWVEISQQIPESYHPDGPIHLIRVCLEEELELDPYDQIEKRLNFFIDDLRKSFIELTE